MKDRLCCQCGEGGGLCESLGTRCTYGCSPYVKSYGPEYDKRKCPAIIKDGVLTDMPAWPNSTKQTNFAEIYKQRCPKAYSW